MAPLPPQHLFATAPLSVWARLLWENRGVDRRHVGLAARIVGKSAALAPLRLAERLVYDRRARGVRIDEPPVFVLGYYRSGTTHLHNLLCRDPRFGCVTTFQVAVASFFLLSRSRRRLRERVASRIQPKRPMDNVSMAADTPQEEELAIGNISRFSHAHSFTFPRKSYEYLEKYALMRGLSEAETRRWDRLYMSVLRKAALACGGKRLVLKSPANTGRAAHLLRLFPDAKFVYIARDPFDVVESNMHLYRVFFREGGATLMQDVAADDMLDYVVHAYAEMTRQYMADRSLIPPGNLAELRFEDLRESPVEELGRLYGELSLPGWEEARPRVEDYLGTLKGYRQNKLGRSPDVAGIVDDRLGFMQEEWRYGPAGAGAGGAGDRP